MSDHHCRGTRVEVNMQGVFSVFERYALATVLDVHPHWEDYLVEFDTTRIPDVCIRHAGESSSRVWVGGEFVRKLSLLELMAEAAIDA